MVPNGDGEKQDLFISFNGNQTSIFVRDEELMFIDESTKGSYTTSDTFGNAVYEGTLRNLTHAEMLTLKNNNLDRQKKVFKNITIYY
ncbi:hypothetical protein LOY85_04580 [Brevibacillus brevis]|uniref:hypothetical protein n=1 Tax=Brevibacillus brevis TaxID=1393 RepID=UPI001F3F8CAF|nr:hypothetical protein [Brevibacillus brevis]UIO43441.1 hypothetical protein LOY85_04580 [Brevibacillus brevis]